MNGAGSRLSFPDAYQYSLIRCCDEHKCWRVAGTPHAAQKWMVFAVGNNDGNLGSFVDEQRRCLRSVLLFTAEFLADSEQEPPRLAFGSL